MALHRSAAEGQLELGGFQPKATCCGLGGAAGVAAEKPGAGLPTPLGVRSSRLLGPLTPRERAGFSRDFLSAFRPPAHQGLAVAWNKPTALSDGAYRLLHFWTPSLPGGASCVGRTFPGTQPGHDVDLKLLNNTQNLTDAYKRPSPMSPEQEHPCTCVLHV